jgi:formylglycine-generating enzyme required for sulfatase activity
MSFRPLLSLLAAFAVALSWLATTRARSDQAEPPKMLDCTSKRGASAAEVQSAQQSRAKHLKINPTESAKIADGITMTFALLPPGKFIMGSPQSEKDRAADEIQHEVTISKAFYIGIHAVTRGQFRRFVDDTHYQTEAEKPRGGGLGWDSNRRDIVYGPKFNWRNPGFEQTDDHPVVLVTWKEATKFADWLSQKGGHTYRLPTEAEWEYACRAGTTSRFYFGDDDEEMVRYGNFATNLTGGSQASRSESKGMMASPLRPPSAAFGQMPSACTTCTVTRASGVPTGAAITQPTRSSTPPARSAATTGSFAVAAFAVVRRLAVRPSVISYIRKTERVTSAFDWSEMWQPISNRTGPAVSSYCPGTILHVMSYE